VIRRLETMPQREILIIGGGLAGSEAAWQGVQEGVRVTLFEMKPGRFSPAHRSRFLAELVCSNSLRSRSLDHAIGLLKEEMRRLGSLIIRTADETAVPAGSALAVDREAFSRRVTEVLEDGGVRIVREEVTQIPETDGPVLICTGPLPSEAISKEIRRLTGADALSFYDAIAPIVDGTTIIQEKVFWASRYGKGGPDYLNCPMDRESYEHFVQEILKAEKVPLHDFESIPAFEGCLPIEDLAARGRDTLAHGPMKPTGLVDPRTGRRPYAVVQLRRDNFSGSLFNMVGFQTKMTWPEQKRVLRTIPGLEKAEFFRYGSLHKNAFLNAPLLLKPTLQMTGDPRVFFAGQITGVEGYVESAAMGLVAGRNAARWAKGLIATVPPPTTAFGALLHYITKADPASFQPMHVNFGIFPPLTEILTSSRKANRCRIVERALRDLDQWIEETAPGEELA